MRIISGKFKGRKITHPNSMVTRPLKDLTKESIFNILQHANLANFKFEKAVILDLFSGVGSFGLECISRGAKNVIFYENYQETVKILKKNIKNLDCEKKTQVIEKNIFNINNLSKLPKKKIDIIFLDPPYKEKKILNLINNIINLKLLKKNGIIILHRHKNEKEAYSRELRIFKIKIYGISKIIFGLVPQ